MSEMIGIFPLPPLSPYQQREKAADPGFYGIWKRRRPMAAGLCVQVPSGPFLQYAGRNFALFVYLLNLQISCLRILAVVLTN